MKDKLIKRQGLNIIGLFILIVVALFTINNIVVMAKIDTTNYLYLNAIQDSIIWNSIKLSIIVYCTFLLTLKVNSNFKLLESINQTRSVRKSVKVSDIGNSTATNECTIPTDKFSKFSTDDLFMAKDIEGDYKTKTSSIPKAVTTRTGVFTPIDDSLYNRNVPLYHPWIAGSPANLDMNGNSIDKNKLQELLDKIDTKHQIYEDEDREHFDGMITKDNLDEVRVDIEIERTTLLDKMETFKDMLERGDQTKKDASKEENEDLDDTVD